MIAIKYPSTKDSRTDFHYLKRQDLNSDFWVRKITELYKNSYPNINTIELETINRCNNDCSFCPVNKNTDTRPYKKMSYDLFEKIIHELAELDYAGYLSLFSNNEPLIDVRIYDFIQYAKEKLPKAIHCLYTNGTLLNEENFLRLVQHLDYLVIDNYNDDLKLLDNVQLIVDKYKDLKMACKVSILVRKKNQILLNRGGVAPNREQKETFTSSCILPFMQLIIQPDGKISRCCQDALAKTTLGDISKDSIKDVWEGASYKEFRTKLIEQGRESVDFCRNCDFFGVMNYFPDFWIHIVTKTLVELVWEKKNLGKKIYVYNDNKLIRQIKEILSYHGIKVNDILYKQDKDEVLQKDSFTIFPPNEDEILDEIDYDFKHIGENYIVYNGTDHSLHTEFLDENATSDVKEFVHFIDTIRSKKTIVFGTGFSATKVSQIFKIDAAYYIDNNKKKEGTIFEGKKIWLPQRLSEEDKDDICVVIASIRYHEMKKQLVDNRLCKEENIFEGLRYLD